MRNPTIQETLDKEWKSLKTKYGLLSLGVGQDGECTVTQEERENHFHLIGTTGEGKSMLLLRMLMSDIDRIRSGEKGPGICFIDGSENGDTMYKVLGYCEHIGFKNVLVIDPESRFKYKKITPLNPVHTKSSHIQKSVSYLTDAFRVIFSVKDPAGTAYIENYLPAILRVLSVSGLSLDDLKYFTDFRQELMRNVILAMADDSQSVSKLRFAYQNIPLFTKEVGSTMRRLDPIFRDEGLRQMLTHRQGVDFAKLIADRWIILVNVSEMDILPARLLASIVINETVFGLKRLRDNGWNGYEYLYIDEAARYATAQITDILTYKRKLGLRLVLSHQFMGQFRENPELGDAVRVNSKTKIAFYIADNQERMQAVRMMYGGDLEDREVSYRLSEQEKQQAVVKLNKAAPRVIKVHDTPVYKVSKEYLESIYANPWYYTHADITKDQDERFSGQNLIQPERAAQSKHGAPRKTDGRKQKELTKDAEKSVGQKGNRSKAASRRNVEWENLLVEADRGQDPSPKTE